MSAVDLSVYRPEFIAAEREQREQRLRLRDKLWQQREEMRQLLRTEVPEMDSFCHALEDRGDVAAAINTGCLARLEEQGFLTNEVRFASAQLLKRGGRVWSLRWIAHGVLGVDRSGDLPKAANQWNEVVLQVAIDQKARRIDTEFFSLNEALGEEEAAFDDREKFHVVWELTDEGAQRLVYVGLGTNEPYNLEHEDRGVAGASGRPRFYIYDADRRRTLRYEVAWSDQGEFDWDWSVRPVETFGTERRVSFVEFSDGSRFCVSDPELARAASGWTWDKAQECAATIFGALSENQVAELRALFRRFRGSVRGPIEEGRPGAPPELQQLVDRPGCDYVAYFVAATVAGEKVRSAAELIKAARRLEPGRRQEYASLLGRPCGEVFIDEVTAALPRLMGELFALDQSRVTGLARRAVEQWTTAIADEVRRDLYHYGQSPLERMNRMRLGAHLALSERHGGLYWKVLEQARKLLEGEEPHGQFAVSLAPV